MIRAVAALLADQLAVARATPRDQWALRLALVLAGGLALAFGLPDPDGPEPLLAAVGGTAVLGSAAWPASTAPLVVLVTAGLAWTTRWGVDTLPPAAPTLALASLLYLHHTTAALCAAMPSTARVDPLLLVRWYGRALAVLAAATPVAAAVFLLGRTGHGLWPDLAGLAGVLATVGALTVLARRPRQRSGG